MHRILRMISVLSPPPRRLTETGQLGQVHDTRRTRPRRRTPPSRPTCDSVPYSYAVHGVIVNTLEEISSEIVGRALKLFASGKCATYHKRMPTKSSTASQREALAL